MAKLIYKFGSQSQDIPLAKPSFTAGRSGDNDLAVPDNLLSRQHMAIRKENGQFVLHDLGSTNGTFVNDEKVTRRALASGDVVRIGDATLTFVGDGPAPAPKARAAGPPTPSPITHLAATRDIVRHIDDIAEPLSLRINLSDLDGAKLEEMSRSIAVKPGAGKETSMFFVLYHICKAVSSVSTLDDILKTSMKLIFDVVNAERGAIVLYDQDKKTSRIGIATHRTKGVLSHSTFPISQTIVQRVINDRVALISHDTLTDAGFQEALSIVNLSIRSALCVPLWESDQVYGAIYMDNRAATHAFTQPDLELLTAIANLVAIRLSQEKLNDRLRTEEVMRNELMHYFSPDVADMIIKGGDQFDTDLAQREITVSFIDIENSTTLAEKLGPDRISQILDWFYETAAASIFEHDGNINNFIGDAVMGIYNAPLNVPDHPVAAIKSAVHFLNEIRIHNEEKPEEAFNVRVGINTGTVMVGDVGITKRHFTALGDPVNVAERLTRFPQVNTIIIGPETYARVKTVFECRELGRFKLKGKTVEVPAYQVVVDGV